MPRHLPVAIVFVLSATLIRPAVPAPQATATSPADAFLAQIASLEGRAFEGRIVANDPAQPDDPFESKRLVMHVRRVVAGRIEIPFHVGDDRSRTWILTRTTTGLRLKHDHRHEDGTPDVLTQYGGDTVSPESVTRQEFPADTFSRQLFTVQNRHVSLTNVWAMEIEPGQRFSYELRRPGRLFRVDFDLGRPVPAPPTPWGW